MKIEFTCAICGKSFLRYKSAILREPNRGKCCSNLCRIEYTRKKIKKKCIYCNENFFVFPSNQKISPLLYCSKECRKGDKRILIRCKVCGGNFLSYKIRLRKVCSHICRGKNNEGDNNSMRKIPPEKRPNWRGGIALNLYPPGWLKSFKKKIRQRDFLLCQICGITTKENNKELDVHHIDYNKNNLSNNNLITLCQVCHGKTNHHREFWKGYFYERRNKAEDKSFEIPKVYAEYLYDEAVGSLDFGVSGCPAH